MVRPTEAPSLGQTFRDARLAQATSLRSFAAYLGISPSYLSDIENDNRIPAEPLALRICIGLNLDADTILGMSGRVGELGERYLRTHPNATLLIRRLAAYNWTDEQVAVLLGHVADQAAC